MTTGITPAGLAGPAQIVARHQRAGRQIRHQTAAWATRHQRTAQQVGVVTAAILIAQLPATAWPCSTHLAMAWPAWTGQPCSTWPTSQASRRQTGPARPVPPDVATSSRKHAIQMANGRIPGQPARTSARMEPAQGYALQIPHSVTGCNHRPATRPGTGRIPGRSVRMAAPAEPVRVHARAGQ
jgi:hypothetical protein